MPSVSFYFQVHQPWRLKRCSFFSPRGDLAGSFDALFDREKNGTILRKVANKCYLPMNRLLEEVIHQHNGAFRVSFSITGTAIEQMKEFAPEVLDSFRSLVRTGAVEILGETYYHSLAALYDRDEFVRQVRLHTALMKSEFGVTPTVFRNTELIYRDEIGRWAGELGFAGIIAEGVDDVLGWRSPNFVYSVPGSEQLGAGYRPATRLLLKNYRLSDDIAFRFSNRGWESWPLTSETFASWVHRVSGNGDTVNLFMDYETFGEHQWESTGIFDFMRVLPERILARPDWSFATPAETIARYPVVADLPFHRLTSWADIDRDTTAWQGNAIQHKALNAVYALREEVLRHADPRAQQIWRRLLTSDHFYYMCTKWFADGDVHAYFSPYESPYEAFINYMNALRQFESVVRSPAVALAV